MINFKNTIFEGSLYELFEELKAWLPDPKLLIKGQKWVYRQLDESNPFLLVRTFSGHRNRGEIYRIDNHQFCPVDNEPLAELYNYLREENGKVFNQSLFEAIRTGNLPISWFINRGCLDIPDGNIRVGPAKAAFRGHGILLAHILDASKGLSGDGLDVSVERFLRTMSPVNIFPWPGIKHTTQRIVRVGSSAGDFRGIGKDLSGAQEIQALMAMCLYEYLKSEGDAMTEQWFKTMPLVKLEGRNWIEKAKGIVLEIKPNRIQYPETVEGETRENYSSHDLSVVDKESSAFSRVPLRSGLSINEISHLYISERASRKNTIQLDGERSSNQSKWYSFKIDWFPKEKREINVFANGKVVRSVVLNLDEFNRTYHFRGDTKCVALDHFFQNLQLADCEIDLLDLVEPCLTESGTPKLIMKMIGKTNGFYCYGDGRIDFADRLAA